MICVLRVLHSPSHLLPFSHPTHPLQESALSNKCPAYMHSKAHPGATNGWKRNAYLFEVHFPSVKWTDGKEMCIGGNPEFQTNGNP